LDDLLVVGRLDGRTNVALELLLPGLAVIAAQLGGLGPALLDDPALERAPAEAEFGREMTLADGGDLVFSPRRDQLVLTESSILCHDGHSAAEKRAKSRPYVLFYNVPTHIPEARQVRAGPAEIPLTGLFYAPNPRLPRSHIL
jgi:hypothetical protein